MRHNIDLFKSDSRTELLTVSGVVSVLGLVVWNTIAFMISVVVNGNEDGPYFLYHAFPYSLVMMVVTFVFILIAGMTHYSYGLTSDQTILMKHYGKMSKDDRGRMPALTYKTVKSIPDQEAFSLAHSIKRINARRIALELEEKKTSPVISDVREALSALDEVYSFMERNK